MEHDCPVMTAETRETLTSVMYYVEGVAQTVVAIVGILLNLVFSLILSKRELRNSFNILLIVLAVFDSTYLLCSILESFRKSFHMATNLHVQMFPFFLYPTQGIALTGSIFMTVAIAFERYVAVHNPINYNRAMNDVKATTARVVRFVVPVIMAAVLFSLPKFFESTVMYRTELTTDESGQLVNVTRAMVNHTAFRVHPTYARYITWSKLVVQGVVPVVLLIFFNKKIYRDVKERQQRWRAPGTGPMPSASQMQLRPSIMLPDDFDEPPSAEMQPLRVFTNGSVKTNGDANDGALSVANGGFAGLRNNSMQSMNGSVDGGSIGANAEAAGLSSRNHLHVHSRVGRVPSTLSPSATSLVDRNTRRRRVEDRLALLFMGIVAVFFACNLPRILLHIYETVIMEKAVACAAAGKGAFPAWVWIMMVVSHLLLVVNSSVNMIIYCFWNAQFRKVARSTLLEALAFFSCGCLGLAAWRQKHEQQQTEVQPIPSSFLRRTVSPRSVSVATNSAPGSRKQSRLARAVSSMLPHATPEVEAGCGLAPHHRSLGSSVVVLERAEAQAVASSTTAVGLYEIARLCIEVQEMGEQRNLLRRVASSGAATLKGSTLGSGSGHGSVKSVVSINGLSKPKAVKLQYRETRI